MSRAHVAIIAGIVFLLPHEGHARTPVMVDVANEKDIITIEDPGLSQAFYGEMAGFPHTFEIRAEHPFTLVVRILVPDADGAKDNVEGIIIKEGGRGKRVEEIARLAKSESWLLERWWQEAEPYRAGPYFEGVLEPGVYRIEMHTADNVEKYVMHVGTREELSIGYFELLSRIALIKEFSGKSKFRVVESPYAYVPLLFVLLVGLFLYRRRRMIY